MLTLRIACLEQELNLCFGASIGCALVMVRRFEVGVKKNMLAGY